MGDEGVIFDILELPAFKNIAYAGSLEHFVIVLFYVFVNIVLYL